MTIMLFRARCGDQELFFTRREDAETTFAETFAQMGRVQFVGTRVFIQPFDSRICEFPVEIGQIRRMGSDFVHDRATRFGSQ